MRESDRDYARGYELVAGGGGVPDAVVKRAAELAPETERRALFGPEELPLDGWRFDQDRQVRVPPDRDDTPMPARPSAADWGVARDGPGGASPLRAAPTPRTAPVDLSEQRAAAARLSDSELAERIREAERWERWYTDPEYWRWRWDRRVLYIGRALRQPGLVES